MAETSEKTPEEAQEDIEASEGETTEPAEEDTSEIKTELDSVKETLAETQVTLKRYKEQVSGHGPEVQRLQKKIEELEARIPPEKEPLTELSPQDQETRAYLKKLGVFTQKEVEKMVQEKVAPFQAEREARGKSEQKKVLEKFIKNKPDLGDTKDPEGVRMQRVLGKLKRIAPDDPFDPNASLETDLELAYKWAFEEETNKEALSKAKATGRAEGHEASEAKVGEGASTSSPAPKKQRTSEQEEMLKYFGVDDESISKKMEK